VTVIFDLLIAKVDRFIAFSRLPSVSICSKIGSFSKYRAHKIGNKLTDRRTDERTDRKHYASASLDWWSQEQFTLLYFN